MAEFVNLYNGEIHYGLRQITLQSKEGEDTIYHLDLASVPGFTNPNPRRRRRRPSGVGPVQRFLDPDREHPFLKSLLQTAGPILQAFISSQLPTLLNSLTETINPSGDGT